MNCTVGEVLSYIKENDVKFIKLTFCDIFGRQKNISLLASELENAFKYGVPFDASAAGGLMNITESDLLLFPDPATLNVLPWRPQSGRVVSLFCNIRYEDLRPFECDSIKILSDAVKRLKEYSMECRIGTNCEFYILGADENGQPLEQPFDKAGYLDAAPLDRCENIRRDIVFTLENMGIMPTSSHHEKGPGQNEIDFKYSDPVNAARNMLVLKSAVKNVCGRNGVYATFMPKPFEGESGSGLHLNIALKKHSKELPLSSAGDGGEADGFIEGILTHMAEIAAFTNSTTNSYKRLGESGAPQFVSWSAGNLSQMLRISKSDNTIKLRSLDSVCNPFIVFALILHAGMDGMDKKLKLRDAVDVPINALSADEKKRLKVISLPDSLEMALEWAKKSNWLKSVLSETLIEKYICVKRAEIEEMKKCDNCSRFEFSHYLDT